MKLWHGQKITSLNMPGSNFMHLPVNEQTIEAQYLKLYQRLDAVERKPILRKRSRFSNGGNSTSGLNALPMRVSRKSLTRRKSQAGDDRSPEKQGPRKTVLFSPYNKVQEMSPRNSASVVADEEPIFDDDYDFSGSSDLSSLDDDRFLSPPTAAFSN